MRTSVVCLILCLALFAGCSGTSPFATLSAVDAVADSYSSMIPGDGNIQVLATKPYRSGTLVLARKQQDGGAALLDLFWVEKGGVSKVAGGFAPEQDPFSFNQLTDGGYTVLFGQYGPGAEEKPYQTAVMTLRNWKTVERELDKGAGFILFINKGEIVRKFDLLGPDGEVAAGLHDLRAGGIRTTSFVHIHELPLPRLLAADSIREVRLQTSVKADVDGMRVVDEAGRRELVAVFNSVFARQKRVDGRANPRRAVLINLADGQTVTIHEAGPAVCVVVYENGRHTLQYTVEGGELNSLIQEMFAAGSRDDYTETAERAF